MPTTVIPEVYLLNIDGAEHTNVKRPEDSKEVANIYQAYYFDILYRWIPGMKCMIDRKHRVSDNF